MKRIADPLYNIILIPDILEPLLDSYEVQRLRRIKQLGTAFLVYPSANHTRFEHSLGTAYLAYKIAEQLELDKDLYFAIGLLHDIGHGPFSHVSEEILLYLFNISHEEITLKKLRSLKDILSDASISIKEVSNEIKGKGIGIVSGELDADRLDYLQRDAYFTGNFSGLNNVFYLIYNFKLYQGKLALPEKAISIVESILLGRLIMYKAVYLHKTVIASAVLLQESIKNLLDYYSPFEIYEMDDYMLVSTLREIEDPFYQELEKRELPKLVATLDKKINEKEKNELLEELRSLLNTDRVYIWPYYTKKPKTYGTKVIIDGEIRPLYSVSNLIRDLIKQEEDLYKLRIYIDKSVLSKKNIERLYNFLQRF